jgi:hypothetical protein
MIDRGCIYAAMGAEKPPSHILQLDGNLLIILSEGNFFSLWAFLTLGDGEFNLLAFIKGFKTITADIAVVDENVWAAFLLNKTKTFLCVKPFNSTDSHM